MTRKRFYDEHGNEIRSRPRKPIYKKWWLWMIVALGVTFGIIEFYTFGSIDEPKDLEVRGETDKEETRVKDPEIERSENEIVEDQTYTYEDFKGTYVVFEGEPYNSPIISNIIVLGDDDYRTFNRWDYDMTSIIQDKHIDENTLEIDVDSDENEAWGPHSESGTEQFELRFDGDQKVLYHQDTEDFIYYPMSDKDLQENYKQSEIDYARIIMTLRGVPSLDFWGAFSSEYDGDKPVIGITYNNKGDFIPHTIDEGDVEYPEDVTNLYLKNKTRRDEISYTYSSVEDGYIRVYPIPLNHALKTGEEVIDDAKEQYIKPFEPYGEAIKSLKKIFVNNLILK